MCNGLCAIFLIPRYSHDETVCNTPNKICELEAKDNNKRKNILEIFMFISREREYIFRWLSGIFPELSWYTSKLLDLLKWIRHNP